MFSKKLSSLQYWCFSGISIIGVIVLWGVGTSSGMISALFLPSPIQVIHALKDLFVGGQLFVDIGASLFRIVLGFLFSAGIALLLGVALGISRRAGAFIEPLVSFIRFIPPSAFIPLAILWFGVGEYEKVFIIFIGIAPYLTLLVADAVLHTRKELIEAALTLGASKYDLITKVVIPFALPSMWDAMRLMIGAAWTFVIIAEIVGASTGLGRLMIESQRFLRTDSIFACIVILGVLGLCTDYFFKATHRIFFPWTHKISLNE
ncbi:MAG: ABC transporter permease [bacterium]|nr:ABC transporter permease [bacterium]